MIHRPEDVLEGFPLTQPHAHRAVAGQVHEARQHDVARAGQPRQRLRPRAHLGREPPNLRASLRHDGRERVVSQGQALDHARGDGQHVLQRAAHLHAHDVRAGVDPQVRGREEALNPPREILILGRGYDGRRQSLHELDREGGAG